MMNARHPPPDGSMRLVIVEQPQQRGMRFRYECEGRSAGSIPGENTTGDKKTWPSCLIENYQGIAIMRVSLVSKDEIPKPHPHSLVGRDCQKGTCQINVDPSCQMLGVFPNLGIQCVRRKEVNQSIRDRLSKGVNPFNTLVDPDEQVGVDVDLNIVRLCFEAFIPDASGNYTRKLTPVVSKKIYDKKATSSSVLKICRVDKTHGSSLGHDEVFLLCDKVQKEDIQVVFFTDSWEALGEFSPADVHRQVAIVFKTPPYRDERITDTVAVQFMLRRPSDNETSKPLVFTYLPIKHEISPYSHHKMMPFRVGKGPKSKTNLKKAITDRLNHQGKFRNASGRPYMDYHNFRAMPGPSRINPKIGVMTNLVEAHTSGASMRRDLSLHTPTAPLIPQMFKQEPSDHQQNYGEQWNVNQAEPFPSNDQTLKSMFEGKSHMDVLIPNPLNHLQEVEQLDTLPDELLKDDSFPSLGVKVTEQVLKNMNPMSTSLNMDDLDELLQQKCSIEEGALLKEQNMSITEVLTQNDMFPPQRQAPDLPQTSQQMSHFTPASPAYGASQQVLSPSYQPYNNFQQHHGMPPPMTSPQQQSQFGQIQPATTFRPLTRFTANNNNNHQGPPPMAYFEGPGDPNLILGNPQFNTASNNSDELSKFIDAINK